MRLLLIVALALVAACSGRSQTDDDASLSDLTGDWKATLNPLNNSGVRGSVSLQSLAAASQVTVSINGATAGASHPWHIHSGTCGSGGPIVGPADSYPLLSVGADGTATATTSLSFALNDDSRYHVNVHSSPGMGTIIACGNLDN